MIVADTNVIAYLLIPGDHTGHAKALLKNDPEWIAPLLWRSEFRNVLSMYLKLGHLSLDQCLQYMQEAEFLMTGNEFNVSSVDVLRLSEQSGCSSYDCEFVSLAKDQNIFLITSDKKIVKQFPGIAKSLKNIR